MTVFYMDGLTNVLNRLFEPFRHLFKTGRRTPPRIIVQAFNMDDFFL
jgi:hypothetical protein